MPTSPLTYNPIQPGSDGASLNGIPSLPAVVAPTFPAPGKRTTKALGELDKLEGQHARWQAAGVAKNAELLDLEGRVGEEILTAADDEADRLSERLSRQVRDLKGAIDTAGKAEKAAFDKVKAAQRAVLRAELEDLRDLLGAARRAQAEHDEKLARLLDAVKQHDGATYEPYWPSMDANTVSMGTDRPWTPSKSAVLRAAVTRAELMVQIAEAAAAGEPLPEFRAGMPLPADLYSPRVRGAAAYSSLEKVG